MDVLHERLESLVEEYSPEGPNGWEVEYSVSFTCLLCLCYTPTKLADLFAC
jgi:hypothetical protein